MLMPNPSTPEGWFQVGFGYLCDLHVLKVDEVVVVDIRGKSKL
jgi:hypothetical protein